MTSSSAAAASPLACGSPTRDYPTTNVSNTRMNGEATSWLTDVGAGSARPGLFASKI
ncbi:hypothetical protein D3C83_326950 [compost metagenome]